MPDNTDWAEVMLGELREALPGLEHCVCDNTGKVRSGYPPFLIYVRGGDYKVEDRAFPEEIMDRRYRQRVIRNFVVAVTHAEDSVAPPPEAA